MIEVKNLSKNYGDVEAVKSINFSVKDREIIGFLGPNGAGKSTTIKVITGFLAPSAGDVIVNGMDIKTNQIEIQKEIGYLPELNPLYTDMLVYDMLEYVAGVRGIHGRAFKDAFARVIDQCGLSGVVHKRIDQCSKGYKQRIGLACAMIHDPKILILDEPVTGLDPNQIVEIRSLIKELGKKKLVLMSSHILQEIEATVDRIVIINNGEIVADGSNRSILRKFSGASSIEMELLGVDKEEVKKIEEKIDSVKVSSVRKSGSSTMVSLSCKGKSDPREDIFKYAVKSKWVVLGMSQKKSNLETIFRKLTSEAK